MCAIEPAECVVLQYLSEIISLIVHGTAGVIFTLQFISVLFSLK